MKIVRLLCFACFYPLIAVAPAYTQTAQASITPPPAAASDFHWHSTQQLILPKPDATGQVDAVKDLSVVYANGEYHIFMTVAGAGGWCLAETSFKDWADSPDAPVNYLDASGIGKGYRAAPQVFYFAPQKL